jgi:hypothetical protein
MYSVKSSPVWKKMLIHTISLMILIRGETVSAILLLNTCGHPRFDRIGGGDAEESETCRDCRL